MHSATALIHSEGLKSYQKGCKKQMNATSKILHIKSCRSDPNMSLIPSEKVHTQLGQTVHHDEQEKLLQQGSPSTRDRRADSSGISYTEGTLDQLGLESF